MAPENAGRKLVLRGHHVKGRGLAHFYGRQHMEVFGAPMVGTFNIKLEAPFPPPGQESLYPPSRVHDCPDEDTQKRYWFCLVGKGNMQRKAWIFRWTGSRMPNTILELISREPLPEEFREGTLEVRPLIRWSKKQIDQWARGQYWWQNFDWAPPRADGKPKADSLLLQRVLTPYCNWSGLRVLDIGTHYGYHAFWMSRLGAIVTGVDVNKKALEMAETIDEYIEQEGVNFLHADPGGKFDVILYLSVHHQWDPSYTHLTECIEGLRERAGKLFVELILPESSFFGKGYTEKQVDRMVRGKTLLTYTHPVRGKRRLYLCEN